MILKWFSRLLFIAIATILLTFCCFLGISSIVFSSGERFARDVAPPVYPKSELIEQWKSGGPISMWDRRTYQTDDELETVLLFYEEHMPGFTKSEFSRESEIAYSNFRCNEGYLSKLIASIVYGSEEFQSLPCAGVTLIDRGEEDSVTQINLSLDWPAP